MAHLQRPDTSVPLRITDPIIAAEDHYVVLDGPVDVLAAVNTGLIKDVIIRGTVNCIYFPGRNPAMECLQRLNAEASRVRKLISGFHKQVPARAFKDFAPKRVR